MDDGAERFWRDDRLTEYVASEACYKVDRRRPCEGHWNTLNVRSTELVAVEVYEEAYVYQSTCFPVNTKK